MEVRGMEVWGMEGKNSSKVHHLNREAVMQS